MKNFLDLTPCGGNVVDVARIAAPATLRSMWEEAQNQQRLRATGMPPGWPAKRERNDQTE
jgi:hypothetical protein